MLRKGVKSIGGSQEYFLEEMTYEQVLKGWLGSHGARCRKNHRVITAGIY